MAISKHYLLTRPTPTNQALTLKKTSEKIEQEGSIPYLSNPRVLQFWSSLLVVLPVFLQAPWVRLQPLTASIFTFVLIAFGISLTKFGQQKWELAGSLLIGVSGSWLGGCLFWGWLRANPVWHLPVESFALPIALIGLRTRWRVGAGFYLSCLLGTAFTDLMILVTGLMDQWPVVVEASLDDAPALLNQTAESLINPQSIGSLLLAGTLIAVLARFMKKRASFQSPFSNTWLVASAALTTTLWVDALFLVTAIVQPDLSGLI